jgi:hypothetical protein
MYVKKSSIAALLLLAAGGAHAACSFGPGGSEPSLQSVFDTVLGPDTLSATSDCVSSKADRTWSAPAEAVATIVIELAGYASKNQFGIYQPGDRRNRITLFDGADSAGANSTVRFDITGSGFRVSVDGADRGEFAGSEIGFFLAAPGNVFYSDPKLNRDHGDHMYAYAGTGTPFVGGPLAGQNFATTMYLLAFEDLPFCRNPRDFQDFVALVNFVAPVPLPASGFLLAGALALLALWRSVQDRNRAVIQLTSV